MGRKGYNDPLITVRRLAACLRRALLRPGQAVCDSPNSPQGHLRCIASGLLKLGGTLQTLQQLPFLHYLGLLPMRAGGEAERHPSGLQRPRPRAAGQYCLL